MSTPPTSTPPIIAGQKRSRAPSSPPSAASVATQFSQVVISPAFNNSVPSSPPPVYAGIQAIPPGLAPAGIGDSNLLQPPLMNAHLTTPLTTAPSDDPTLPRVDHMEYRLSSFDRSQGDAAFRVQELADILDHELRDATYNDPDILKKLFPDKYLPVERKELLSQMKRSEGFMPDFIKQFDPAVRGKTPVVVAAPVVEDSDSEDNYTEGNGKKKKGLMEEDKLAAWTDAIKIDLNSIAKSLGKEGSSRTYDSDSSTIPMVGESSEKRKPDLILLAKAKVIKGTRGRWQFALFAIEYTKLENFPLKLLRQMAQRAALMLHNSPGRRFAPLMAISGTQFMICVYHRSGVNYSQRYSIFDNRHTFYSVMAGLYFCDYTSLGFDPNIKRNKHFLPYSVDFKGVQYKIIKKLDVKEGIQGCGTVCWIVQHPVTGKLYTMKLSWIEKAASASPELQEFDTEVAYYRSMNKKCSKGVPTMVDYEDTKIKNVVETTGIWRTNEPHKNFCERTYRKLLLDGIGRPLTYFRSLKELLSAAIDIVMNHGGLYFEANLLHMDMSLRNIMLIDKYPTTRTNVVTEQASVATNAYDVPTGTGLLTSLRTRPAISSSQTTVSSTSSDTVGSSAAVSGSEDSASGEATPTQEDTSFLSDADSQEDKKIISLYKLARGLIVDFDFAAIVKLHLEIEEALKEANIDPKKLPSLFKVHERQLRMRTGTLPYMAIQVLLGCGTDGKPFHHTYQNDLESIIYGLMKMCIYQAGPNNTKRDFKKDPIPSVYSGTKHLPTDFWVMKNMTWAELGFMKTITWTNLEGYVLPCIHKYFVDLVLMFVELREAFFPRNKMPQADYDRRIHSKVTYAAVLRILQKYRDLLPDEDALSPPPDPYADYPGSDSDSEDEAENEEPRRSGRVVNLDPVDYNVDYNVDLF